MNYAAVLIISSNLSFAASTQSPSYFIPDGKAFLCLQHLLVCLFSSFRIVISSGMGMECPWASPSRPRERNREAPIRIASLITVHTLTPSLTPCPDPDPCGWAAPHFQVQPRLSIDALPSVTLTLWCNAPSPCTADRGDRKNRVDIIR